MNKILKYSLVFSGCSGMYLYSKYMSFNIKQVPNIIIEEIIEDFNKNNKKQLEELKSKNKNALSSDRDKLCAKYSELLTAVKYFDSCMDKNLKDLENDVIFQTLLKDIFKISSTYNYKEFNDKIHKDIKEFELLYDVLC